MLSPPGSLRGRPKELGQRGQHVSLHLDIEVQTQVGHEDFEEMEKHTLYLGELLPASSSLPGRACPHGME